MAETQELIVDLRLRDNISLGLGKVKDALGNIGDTGRGEALKLSGAFATAGDRIRSSFAGLGADIQKGIGLGLGFGATQLVARGVSELTGFVKDSIQAFADEEAGIKRLTQALEVNAPAWDRDSAAIERTIQARQKLAFADDELRESLGSLTAATHDVDEGFRLQALAMDLARFQGISLVAASEQLVKVQAGSFRTLKALGIELDKNATSTEALAAIQRVVAGQAEKFAETTAGAMARAAIAVQNLQEDIGEGLAPAIEKAANALDDILSKDLPSFAENSKREIEDLSQGFRDLAEFIHLTDVADFSRDFAVFIRLAQDGKPAITGITEAVIAQSIAMGDSNRETLLSAKTLGALGDAASSATPAEIALARATIDAAAAHADVASAQKLAAEAAAGDTTAIVALAVAMAADKRASDELKAAQDALSKTAVVLKANTLGTGVATDTLDIALRRAAEAAIKAAVGYGSAADQLDRLKATGGKPFIAPPTIKIPGLESDGLTGVKKGEGVTGPESFIEGLILANQNAAAAAARLAAAKAAADQKAAEALAKAKAAAADYAGVLRDKLDRALSNAKDTATTLFDKLHDRTLRAIKDTETLAQKQHDASLQQVADALKLSLSANAAPVTAAEASQRAIELARQRRDLGESLASAQASGDPAAIRSAREALQSFVAQQNINALRLAQAEKDAAAQEDARTKQKVADDQLAAAKLQAARDIEFENNRAKKQRDDYDRALEALKRRLAEASPGKIAREVDKLQEKFGITKDDRGFSHITDTAAAAVKRITPPLTDVGVAAAGATPKLAGLAGAEVTLGQEGIIAADRLAIFTKRLGDLKVLELPALKQIDPPITRQPEAIGAAGALTGVRTAAIDAAKALGGIDLGWFGDAALAAAALAGQFDKLTAKSQDNLVEVARPLVPREPVLDRPRSVEDMLANAIKNIPIPVQQIFVGPINVYVPPQILNGRVVAAALASSQSPTATPGIRAGALAPRP